MRRPKHKKQEQTSVDNEMEGMKEENKRDIKKIDKTILDNFYKLVHTQTHVRLTAAKSTFKILATMNKRSPDKFNEHLNYCVERLVSGLASSRACARRGYATLLLELLATYQISTERLLSIAHKKFGSIPHEAKDNLIGYYLLITIILESGNYKWKSDKDTKYAEKMYKYLQQLRFRKSYFEKPVNKILVRYYDVFKPHMQTEDILDRLADPPASILNGKHSLSDIEKLFLDCSPETLEVFLVKLIGTFSKQHGAEGRKLYPFCAKQMTNLIRRPQMINRHRPVMKLAKFLIMNGLLKRVDTTKVNESFWTEHDAVPAAELLNTTTKATLQAAYHATLDHIVSTCDAQDRLTLMSELILFTNALISSGAVTFLDAVGDISQQWKDYMKCLNSHRKSTTKSDSPKILFPITGLYLFYGFQILEHGLECKEQLDELAQSSKDALKNDPSDGSWADVLTDQIIAMLSATECNPWIRRLCVSIFGSLLPHISETSIDLICDVFKMPIGGDEDKESDDEEGEDDGEAAENGDQEIAMDQDDKEAEEYVSGIEEKVSTNNQDESCDSELGRKLDETLIKSKSGEEGDEEEEEEYLDDEQMMKLDSVLADMFKLNRVGKKKQKDPSFQLRCLDLVKKILQKKHSDSELIRKVLATIVPFATKCRRHKETRPIAEKITKMIAKMPGKAQQNSLKKPHVSQDEC